MVPVEDAVVSYHICVDIIFVCTVDCGCVEAETKICTCIELV